MAERTLKALEPQLGLDEEVREDPELEAILERRLRAADDLGEVRKVYDGVDAEAKGAIERLGLEEGVPLRIGRFRLERQSTPGGHREFDTKPSTRLKIRLVG